MIEEIPPYFCKRIKSQVYAEKAEDITGRIIVQCKYDNYNQGKSCTYFDYLCLIGFSPKKCLVKLVVQRREKERGRVSFY